MFNHTQFVLTLALIGWPFGGSKVEAEPSHLYAPVAIVVKSNASDGESCARATTLLRNKRIGTTFGGRLDAVTIVAVEDRADEARRILAQAIKTEGLQVTLVKVQDGHCVTLRPEDVLK